MASANQRPIFKDGGSNNKPPLFCGEYFDFWKIQMKAHLEAQGEEVWEAVQQGPHVPTTVVNGVGSEKPKASWDDNDRKRVLADKKAISLLHGALSMDEFFRVSTCTTSKEIWDTLVETHEGTAEVKRSRLNTLSQEYELFRMKPGETILDLQKRFVHLTNHLKALGKTLTTEELNLKVLRSLTREWQPKVTAISEKKNLSKMTSATLFGKLQEYETELGRLETHEIQIKDSKDIALKTRVKHHDSNQEDESTSEEDNEFIKKFEKFLRKEKKKEIIKEEAPTRKIKCFECGERGHVKSECPKLEKKNKYFKKNKDKKSKKAYVAWDDNEISSSSDEEHAILALVATHHSDDEDNEDSNEFSLFDNDVQDAINELLNECKTLYKTISSQKKIISSLEKKVKIIEEEQKNDKEKMISVQEDSVACKNCESLSFQIVQLKRVLERYEKGQIGLEGVLRQQRFPNDKSGLGYAKSKPSTSKTIFVKAGEQFNKLGKAQKVYHHPKRFPKKKPYVPRYKSNFEPTCFYCGIIGHTPNACYVRNFSVPNGHYVWVKKGTNYDGPKAHWVPNQT